MPRATKSRDLPDVLYVNVVTTAPGVSGRVAECMRALAGRVHGEFPVPVLHTQWVASGPRPAIHLDKPVSATTFRSRLRELPQDATFAWVEGRDVKVGKWAPAGSAWLVLGDTDLSSMIGVLSCTVQASARIGPPRGLKPARARGFAIDAIEAAAAVVELSCGVVEIIPADQCGHSYSYSHPWRPGFRRKAEFQAWTERQLLGPAGGPDVAPWAGTAVILSRAAVARVGLERVYASVQAGLAEAQSATTAAADLIDLCAAGEVVVWLALVQENTQGVQVVPVPGAGGITSRLRALGLVAPEVVTEPPKKRTRRKEQQGRAQSAEP